MTTFKVGDRVRIKKANAYWKGRVGTVTEINANGGRRPITVGFTDENASVHPVDWYSPRSLELVESQHDDEPTYNPAFVFEQDSVVATSDTTNWIVKPEADVRADNHGIVYKINAEEYENMKAEIERLKAERDQARAALKPFADTEKEIREMRQSVYDTLSVSVLYGWLKAAADALAEE